MIGWEAAWKHTVGLPEGTPQWLVAAVALILVFSFVVLPSAAAISYLDRKLSADLQARVGPNRAGPAGILQPIADLLKLLQKQGGAGFKTSDTVWIAFQTMALYSTLALLPLGSLVLIVDTDMSVFLAFWATLLLSLGTLLMGLGQRSVPGWLGGMRVAAQASAASFPALLAVLCAGMRAGGFSWSAMIAAQGFSPLHWAALTNPFEFIAWVVFVISGLVLLNISPLDGGHGIQDLQGGVSSRLSGRRLSLVKLGRFYGFFLWSVMAVVLFLGGWSIPVSLFDALREVEAWRTLQLLELAVLLLKTFALMITISMVGTVTPRLRSDQITDFCWKVLSPFALSALAGTALWIGWAYLS